MVSKKKMGEENGESNSRICWSSWGFTFAWKTSLVANIKPGLVAHSLGKSELTGSKRFQTPNPKRIKEEGGFPVGFLFSIFEDEVPPPLPPQKKKKQTDP